MTNKQPQVEEESSIQPPHQGSVFCVRLELETSLTCPLDHGGSSRHYPDGPLRIFTWGVAGKTLEIDQSLQLGQSRHVSVFSREELSLYVPS
ncbi:unnamed protein product [Pleuronectes platessa]|uniref:Uncharacterized protein n=1 Tax=Pleuronectes platessa TaxID=8262 RepID=A0A9N7UFP8_PLEPL|nr:unnamed protein product [Pleuronectes platessa]